TDERGVHAAGQDQILQQPAHVVVREGGHHRGPQAEAAAQATCHVVFAAALPCAEVAGRPDAPLARIQTQHHLAERHQVVPAVAPVTDVHAASPRTARTAAAARRVTSSHAPAANRSGATIHVPPTASTAGTARYAARFPVVTP